MLEPNRLTGKTVLVTGASSGIGRCTALLCAQAGAQVVITGRDEARLQAVADALEGTGHVSVACDLTDETGIARLVDAAPALDGAFFCAGVSDTTLTKFLTKERIDRVMDVNLTAPMLLTRALSKKKRFNAGASLVFMSSVGAEAVTPGLGIYAASKAGLNAFMRGVAAEFAPRKIRANSIMAGMVKTELIGTLSSLSDADIAADEARYPLGYGRPEDVAWGVIYLLSDESRWMTGSVLRMDGGYSLR